MAKVKIIGFLFLWSFLPLSLSAQNQDNREGDEAALSALYTSTDGNNWNDNTGWNSGNVSLSDEPVGVTIETVDGELRVTGINMQAVTVNSNGEQLGNNLTGTLPDEIGNLTKCEFLKVKTNNLTGEIPSSIGNMVSLKWLALGGQRCDLDLSNHQWNEYNHRGCPGTSGKEFQETNTISGPIPPEIGNLENLELFEARRQYLTGTIPPEIGNLTNLVGLYLNGQKGPSGERLGGELPPEMGNLTSLKHFHIDNPYTQKGFSGDIPQEIMNNWTEIRHFRLRNNSFTGSIPNFPNATDLRVFVASYNNFTGDFPIEIFQGENPYLNNFIISFNDLSGDLPTDIIPATHNGREWPYNSMAKFGINNNNFTGPVPDWMQEMSGHQVVDLKNNDLTGGFPSLLLDRGQLKTLYVSDNNFSGPLPDKEWASDRMITIYASNSGFTGSIPSSWQTLKRSDGSDMYILYLHNNELEGIVPEWIAELGLSRFYIYGNKFTPKDILPHRDAIGSSTDAGEYKYLPQKPFGQPRNVAIGNTIDRSSFDYSGNSYQWYKDGNAVSGETSPAIDTESYGEGTYILQITHPDIDYTFESEPIEVTEDGGSNPPEIPSLNSPSDGAIGVSNSPALDWDSSSGADTYRLQVATTSDFSSTVTDVSGLTATDFEVSGLNHSTTYYWRVRAVTDGMAGEWSPIWEFTTGLDYDFTLSIAGPEGARMISSPASNTSFEDLFGPLWVEGISGSDAEQGSPTIFFWDEQNQSFEAPSAMTDEMEAGEGYIIWVYEDDDPATDGIQGGFPKNLGLMGAENSSPVSVPVSATDANGSETIDGEEGWNLIGNPYGVPILVDGILAAAREANSQVNANVYIWDPHRSGGADYVSLSEGEGHIIEPFQVFWIRYVTETEGTLTLDKNLLSENNSKQLAKSKADQQADLSFIKFRMEQDDSTSDEFSMEFSEKGQIGIDLFDAYKLSLNLEGMENSLLQMYSVEGDMGERLSKSFLPATPAEKLQIPLGFNNSDNGEVTLTWPEFSNIPPDWTIEIEDVREGRTINLKDSDSYTFTSSSGRDDSRFIMHVTAGSVTGGPQQGKNSVSLSQNYPNPFRSSTEIDYTVDSEAEVSLTVFNVLGKKIATLVEDIQQEQGTYTVQFNASQLSSGIYIYRLVVSDRALINKMTLIK